jgi:hypothetical protein
MKKKNLLDGYDANEISKLCDEDNNNHWMAIQDYLMENYPETNEDSDEDTTAYSIPVELDNGEELTMYVSRINKYVVCFMVWLATKDDVAKLKPDFFLSLLKMNMLFGGYGVDNTGLFIYYNALLSSLSPMDTESIISSIAKSTQIVMKKI